MFWNFSGNDCLGKVKSLRVKSLKGIVEIVLDIEFGIEF